jgi:hypothetical protein
MLLVSAVLRRYDIDAAVAVVSDYTADLGSAFGALRSGSLQQLLAFVREVVSRMERTNPATQAPLDGLKMESLAKLKVGHIACSLLSCCCCFCWLLFVSAQHCGWEVDMSASCL